MSFIERLATSLGKYLGLGMYVFQTNMTQANIKIAIQGCVKHLCKHPGLSDQIQNLS